MPLTYKFYLLTKRENWGTGAWFFSELVTERHNSGWSQGGTCWFWLSELKFPAAVSKGTGGTLGKVNKTFCQRPTSCSINTTLESILVKQSCGAFSPKKGTRNKTALEVDLLFSQLLRGKQFKSYRRHFLMLSVNTCLLFRPQSMLHGHTNKKENPV